MSRRFWMNADAAPPLDGADHHVMRDIFGGGGSTVVNSTPAPSAQELELIQLNADLAKRQLANLDSLQPFQQELLKLTMDDLRRQGALNTAYDSAVSPEDQAAAYKADFERAQKLGPVQDELLQLQLDQLRRGGAATPEQEKLIREATDAGIAAGSADIDASTQRGIGLIADELANARGLRLSDSPISSEAALLAREGVIQKGSLTKNLRAAEASSKLNYPLAVQQLQSGIANTQQQLTQSASQFQADLRQRAYQNRLALTGQTSQNGIGLASIGGGGAAALSALSSNRMANGSQSTSRSASFREAVGGLGAIASGIGAIGGFFSDRRLKDDYGVVAETKSGVPLHLFKYKGEGDNDPLRLGVMADEIKQVRPDAVKRHSSGFDVVDYSKVT